MSIPQISKYFQDDHNRLDGLFRTYQTLKLSAVKQAVDAFKTFQWGLERHIVWEEELLFPLFEAKTGMRDSGPTVVMRMEHREIRETLSAIREKVERQNLRTEIEEATLLTVLGAHNQKEETILYPMTDHLANDAERADIFERMKQYPIQKI
ncbi:MAG: hemerythrin domain-containing protein [Candidatus Omnitrophica bacterium]|nr:hemerythrin domain-containing protein [Candidatus Omnitrophota bacterium]MDD5672004.1 hemerythrin domain-containing protein [Candidatus Omnitrophota bacterium]